MGLRDAFANQQDDEDEKAKQPSGQQTQPTLSGGASSLVTGQAAPSTNANPNAPKANAGNASASGSRLQNLKKYVQANQGYNAAGGGLAGQIAQNVNAAKTGLQSNLQQQQNEFNAQTGAQANAIKYDPNAISNVAGKSDASQISDADLAAVTGQLNAQYGGPTELNNSQALLNQANQVTGLGGLAGSSGGRFQLLNKVFARPDYTQGSRRLDQAILESDPNQVAALNATRQGANAAGEEVNQALNSAGMRAQALKNLAAGTRAQAASGIDSSLGTIKSDLQKQAEAWNAQQAAITGKDPGENATPIDAATNELLKSYGLDSRAVTSRYGTYTPGSTATAENVNANKAGVFNKLAALLGKEQLQSAGGPAQGTYGIDSNAAAQGLNQLSQYKNQFEDVNSQISSQQAANAAAAQKRAAEIDNLSKAMQTQSNKQALATLQQQDAQKKAEAAAQEQALAQKQAAINQARQQALQAFLAKK